MTSREFMYWLQGFFELSGEDVLTPEQVKIIKNHVHLVFVHEIDPEAGGIKTQLKLSEAHDGGKVFGPHVPTVMRC